MTDLTMKLQKEDVAADDKLNWIDICSIDSLPYDAGVAALLHADTPQETQIALFRIADSMQVYAISNFDPFSEANVLSRGILCSMGDELSVASPVLKEHFNLRTGQCFEDDSMSIPTYPVKITKGHVLVAG